MAALQQTIEQISSLRWHGFKNALEGQLSSPAYHDLPFEDRLADLVMAEITERRNRRIKALLSRSRLKYKQAMLEDVDFRAARSLDKSVILSLAQNEWVRRGQNIIITGATGTGKTYLACALGRRAMANGFSVHYVRLNNLLSEIALNRATGSYLSWLKKLSKTRVLIIDDFGVCPLKAQDAQELLEIIEDRILIGGVIITSQTSVDHWHSYLNNPMAADALLDRVIHHSHRLNLKGESMRKLKSEL
jgi:DNA replication protein DnaC